MLPSDLYRLHMANAYAIGGYDAGAQMLIYYPSADRIFPILHDTPVILQDTPAGDWALAWFLGLTTDYRPRFAVRDDLLLTSKIAWHESGHALEQTIIQKMAVQTGLSFSDAENNVRTRYWNWRLFRGTWWDQYLFSLTLPVSGGWQYLPGESIAESISAAVGGYVESEWTFSDGKDLAIVNGVYSPQAGGLAARIFWQQLMAEVDMDIQQVTQIARDEANAAMERAVATAGLTDEAIKGLLNFHNHDVKLYTSTGSPLDISARSSGPNAHTTRPEA